jgi:hypothetical protein
MSPLDDDMAFHIQAADLRLAADEATDALEGLAARFEVALPAHTEVERKGKLFSSAKPVQRVTVKLGDRHFALQRERSGVSASIQKVVKGIALRTDAVSLDAWLTAIADDLNALAAQSDQARAALGRIVRP